MEARRIRLQGERGISRQAIAQGMPECSGCTCMLVCALPCAHCTRDRGCSKHPAFPAPSHLRERNFSKARTRCVAGMRNCIHRHCERSEAIHCHLLHAKMDCFASLAMTWIGHGVPDTRLRGVRRSMALIEPEAYPSGVTEILAQSRRPIRTQSWVLRRSAMLTASQMPMAVNATVKASAATLASMR
jgi:hypothetical protein